MKRYQIYKNGRAIKDTDSRQSAFRNYVDTCTKSTPNDCVEMYDSLTGEVVEL